MRLRKVEFAFVRSRLFLLVTALFVNAAGLVAVPKIRRKIKRLVLMKRVTFSIPNAHRRSLRTHIQSWAPNRLANAIMTKRYKPSMKQSNVPLTPSPITTGLILTLTSTTTNTQSRIIAQRSGSSTTLPMRLTIGALFIMCWVNTTLPSATAAERSNSIERRQTSL
jgi:hypothetical protein